MPSIGSKIPVEKFHVSKMNVRAEEPFGDSEEDQLLIANLRRGDIIGPFLARPENSGFGVYVGRRRFLAKRESGVETFTVGADCLIRNVSEEKAREASLIENIKLLRKDMNPIIRAKRLNELISFSPGGIRSTARRLGIGASTLVDWLKPLDLSETLQEAVAEDLMFLSDATRLARMKLPKTTQQKLADTLRMKGYDAFVEEADQYAEKGLKRGFPKDKYIVTKFTWDRADKDEMQQYEKLQKLAEAQEMSVEDYFKNRIVPEHLKTAG